MSAEIPKWPGPGPEEWWWRQPECSPRTRDMYIRAVAKGKEIERRNAEREEARKAAAERKVREDVERNPLYIRF